MRDWLFHSGIAVLDEKNLSREKSVPGKQKRTAATEEEAEEEDDDDDAGDDDEEKILGRLWVEKDERTASEEAEAMAINE
jgi:hypothetical protein